MAAFDTTRFAASLSSARSQLGLSQATLAERAGIDRSTISRFESGHSLPRLDEAFRMALALRVPLQWLMDGQLRPPTAGLAAIAFELDRLGMRDLVVPDAQVPGAFRRDEEVLVLAVSGDRPEPRVVEAVPFILARTPCQVSLVSAFAAAHDRRARTRLGWLADIALSLSGVNGFPAVESPRSVVKLVGRSAADVPDSPRPKPDSLGRPDEAGLPPVWRRWNICYAGRPADFLRRAVELQAALRNNPVVPENVV